jgi:small-conductance mechanosensitive channel
MIEELLKKYGLEPILMLENPLHDWFVAGCVAVAVWSALWSIRKVVGRRYKRFSTAENPAPLRLLAFLVGNTRQFLFLALTVYAAEEFLALPEKIHHVVSNIVLILILLQVGLWAAGGLRFYLELKERARHPDREFTGSLDVVNFVAQLLIWTILTLLALSNIGVNITALLAGLGVGGVAVALALQNILGDLFASLSIAIEKPFVPGDRLVLDTYAGRVEHIGIKTTRLRSDSGEQIILSNADILKSRVRNFGRAVEQRALVNLLVALDLAGEKLKAIPAILESVVREHETARFERCHLKNIGAGGFEFELSFFVRNPAANPLADLQQAINFRIIDEFRAREIEFVYPTQSIRLDQPAAMTQR